MKKGFIPLLFLIVMAILLFVMFTGANKNDITVDKALEIGEEKYLKFLWIVDGAFNSERMNEDFLVNNKKLSDSDKIFKCKYHDKNGEECVGSNFEEEFKALFSNKISYENVYSDGLGYNWYSYTNGKHVFNNIDNCSINRMAINQELKVISISNDYLVFQVSFINGINNKTMFKNFTLVLEDNEWKVNKAFYYDICGMRYYIQ